MPIIPIHTARVVQNTDDYFTFTFFDRNQKKHRRTFRDNEPGEIFAWCKKHRLEEFIGPASEFANRIMSRTEVKV